MTKNFFTNVFHFQWKPQVWLGAVLAAGVPIAAVAWKSSRSTQGAVVQTEKKIASNSVAGASADVIVDGVPQTVSASGFQAWFEGSSNPFLTTAQANDRKMRDALSKVEAALKRRSDVADVFILVDENTNKKTLNDSKPKAVVSIRMRSGALPVSLVDAAGLLVSAALGNVNAEDVEVLDEIGGTRARAQTLDANASMLARESLAIVAACDEQQFQEEMAAIQPAYPVVTATTNHHDAEKAFTPSANMPADSQSANASWVYFSWAFFEWLSVGVLLAGVLFFAWWDAKKRNDMRKDFAIANTTVEGSLLTHEALRKPEAWSASLAFALHRSVAEKPAFIAAAFVERLESSPTARQEVTALLLEMEPWAAERLLSVLPNRSLEFIEQAIKKPVVAVSPQHVRALAEAMISLRNAA